jgi:PAS domain S-box-containing protein
LVTVERREKPSGEFLSPNTLRVYKSALRLLFRQAPGAFWTTDKNLVLTAVVGREGDLLGVSPEDLVGKTVLEFIGTDDPSDPAIARHLAALAGFSSSFRYAFRKNFYEARIEPLRNGGEEIVGTVGVALNVTERKRAEEELEASRARLAEAQLLAHVGSWSWDVETDQVTWSDELFRIYAVDPAEFQGNLEGFLSRVVPEDVDSVRGIVGSAIANRSPFAYSHRIRRPNGELRILETRGDVVSDRAGKILRLTGSCWDVTDQWMANSELAKTASLLRATLEATADGILVVDPHGKITARNQRFSKLWGLPESLATCEDDTLLDFVTSQLEDSTAFLQRVRELYSTPLAESFDILRFKDGRVFERYSIPEKIGSEVLGRVWSFRDVTERERLLRRAEFLADAGRLLASLDIERALEAVAQLAVPYMGDGCAVDLLTDVGGARRLFVVERDANLPIRTEIPRAVLAGHSLVHTVGSLSYMSVPLPGRSTLFGVLTLVAGRDRHYGAADLDLADELARRTALAIENAQLYRAAQEALRVREDFLSIAAHEIRGPITSLHLSIQALRKSPPTSRVMGRLLDVIERDDRQLIRLVDELLDVTRIRGGRLHFDLEHVDLAEITREVTARLGPDLARSGSSLSVETRGDLVGLWDRTRLDQVVTNLVSNAVKYGLGKPIEVTTDGDDERATLVVRDHGIGIDPKAKDRIFDPFARAVSVRNYGGLGLGLYIVRTIVDAFGGTVKVDSTPQAGSTFTVVLPRVTHP